MSKKNGQPTAPVQPETPAQPVAQDQPVSVPVQAQTPAPEQPQGQPQSQGTEQPTQKTKRKAAPMPKASAYTFKPGEQVTLVNLGHEGEERWRSHYEYIGRDGLYDYVRRTTDGAIKRVWLNKLMPPQEAIQLRAHVLALEAAEAQKAAEEAKKLAEAAMKAALAATQQPAQAPQDQPAKATA